MKGSWNCDRVKLPTSSCIAGLPPSLHFGATSRWTGRHAAGQRNNVAARTACPAIACDGGSDAPYLVWPPGFGIWSRRRTRRHFENSRCMKFDPKKLRYSKEGSGRCVSLSTEQKPEGILRRQSSFAEGRVAQIILETAERGCLSRNTFDNPKTRGISCAHLAIRAAAGGTPALRSIWATRPEATEDRGQPRLRTAANFVIVARPGKVKL